MQPNVLPIVAQTSCYPEESLESYLNAMFGYYEKEGLANHAIQGVRSVDKEAVDGGAPTAYRSLFETILAKFGLELKDATFEEIIQGDYYRVLRRYGLVDTQACNNESFAIQGGVI